MKIYVLILLLVTFVLMAVTSYRRKRQVVIDYYNIVFALFFLLGVIFQLIDIFSE